MTRLLYLVTEDYYFLSHRLPMARAARDTGFEVLVAARDTGRGDEIEAEGFSFLPLDIERRGMNPLAELRTLRALVQLYREQRPDIVHHVALKPVLYGALAARLAGVKSVVNAMAGMGFVFIGRSPLARLLRPGVTLAFRALLNRPGSRLLVQNEDDRAFFRDRGLVEPRRIRLIPGSGVDTERLQPLPDPFGPPIAALVGRMLWDKGVGEAVEAARMVRARGQPLRLLLVGAPDPANPRSIPEAQLTAWSKAGDAEWLGQQPDISAIWAHAHIALLPSYREGMPKALLEAAAHARPMLAFDVPGCNAIIRDGETGMLVPFGNIAALAEALRRLAADPALRRRLGQGARALVEQEMSERAIGAGVVALYRELVPSSDLPG